MQAHLAWQPDGRAYSLRYGDVYRTESGALAQALQVFAEGCGLPRAWAGHTDWSVLETGLGLASNFLATWSLWRSDPGRSAGLHYTGIEAHPVSLQDLQRNAAELGAEALRHALQIAPDDLQDMMGQLASRWPTLQPGLQTWPLDEGRVTLTLACGDISPMLDELSRVSRRHDAVYLDGFDPRLNPAMWDATVMQGVSRLCKPAARLASWCVAGHVRRKLRDAGWQVQRVPGLPPKRQRLVASRP